MKVEVHVFGPLREVIGEKRYQCTLKPNSTVEELLDRLCAEFDGAQAILGESNERDTTAVVVTINKRSTKTLEGRKTALTDGDLVRISPPIHGG